MNVRETAILFDCAGERLVGVIGEPPASPADLGVVIVVGGPQYRVGSHRQFVQLARAIAAAGFPVLRFDLRGMGDSLGEPHAFDDVDGDVGAAVDALQRGAASVRRVVLLGLCDGASAALLYVDRRRGDARIAGLCLLNPWVRSEQTMAQTHLKHYYLQRLREGEFWRKLLRGEVAGQALRALGLNLKLALHRGEPAPSAMPDTPPFQERMARAWAAFGGPIHLILSGQDYTAKEFLQAWSGVPAWRAAHRHPATRRTDIAEADHTFSRASDQALLEHHCIDWLRSLGVAAGLPAARGARPLAAQVPT